MCMGGVGRRWEGIIRMVFCSTAIKRSASIAFLASERRRDFTHLSTSARLAIHDRIILALVIVSYPDPDFHSCGWMVW